MMDDDDYGHMLRSLFILRQNLYGEVNILFLPPCILFEQESRPVWYRVSKRVIGWLQVTRPAGGYP
jgi:hypothetical protein